MTVTEPIDLLLVGAGNRGMIYARAAVSERGRARIVGVVEPSAEARAHAAKEFAIPSSRQWKDVVELPEEPVALAAINSTMDALHLETSRHLLSLGYHLLLEKPIGLSVEDVVALQTAAAISHRMVAVCHVLRHAPFYSAIKREVVAGAIGKILTMELSEHVSYDHVASSYVRGPWANEELAGSGMLMAKCCHDLDLMTWLARPASPVRVASAGSRSFFREENAPTGSGSRCVVDCGIERDCAYSAKRLYIDQGRWAQHAFRFLRDRASQPSLEEKLAALADPRNPTGRCVWRADNTVVDHQAVMVEFDTGMTATLTMSSGAAKGDRSIHIVGSKGEIVGSMESGDVLIRNLVAGDSHHSERVVKVVAEEADGHGGGDSRLVTDFLSLLSGRQPTLSTTSLEDSVDGHVVGFAAERARLDGGWVDVEEFGRAASSSADTRR